MAFSLTLTAALKDARWKVKIRDKETREPPHVTIIRGTRCWRLNLRNGEFMDDSPDPAEIPDELSDLIMEATNWKCLCDEWNRMYPDNPVASEENGDS